MPKASQGFPSYALPESALKSSHEATPAAPGGIPMLPSVTLELLGWERGGRGTPGVCLQQSLKMQPGTDAALQAGVRAEPYPAP